MAKVTIEMNNEEFKDYLGNNNKITDKDVETNIVIGEVECTKTDIDKVVGVVTARNKLNGKKEPIPQPIELEKKKSIRQNVEAIMREYPDTRNDDKLLILTYWNLFDKIVKDQMVSPIDVLDKATSTESIRRSRQLIQEEGKYPATDETVIGRRNKEKKMKEAIKNREVV
jgi:hypothetical protein